MLTKTIKYYYLQGSDIIYELQILIPYLIQWRGGRAVKCNGL